MKYMILALATATLPALADDIPPERLLDCAGAFSFAIKKDEANETLDSGMSGDNLGLGMFTYGELLISSWEDTGTPPQHGEAAFVGKRSEMSELWNADPQKFRELLGACFADIT